MANTTIDANKVIAFMEYLGVDLIEVPSMAMKLVKTSTNLSVEALDTEKQDPCVVNANKIIEALDRNNTSIIVYHVGEETLLTCTKSSANTPQPPVHNDLLVQLFEMQAKLNDYTFLKMDISPVQCDHPLSMKHLQTQAQRGTDNSANGDVNTWLNKYLWALMTECEEVKEELLSKWWSSKEINIDNIQKEVVDVLHFFISLAITSGMTAQDLFNKYVEKNAVNFKRLDTGYAPENS